MRSQSTKQIAIKVYSQADPIHLHLIYNPTNTHTQFHTHTLSLVPSMAVQRPFPIRGGLGDLSVGFKNERGGLKERSPSEDRSKCQFEW